MLDKLTYAGNRESLDGLPADRVTLRAGRHRRRRRWSTRWSPRHDVVVHFAAESHNDNSLHDPRPFVHTNIVGTFTLLEAVRRHGTRLHHISTDEVYGDLDLDDPERFTEDTPYNPSSPYSSTKAGSDLLVRAWVRSLRRAGDDLELLQQLRPVPARREVHPAPDHQRARRRPAQALRRRARTCATGSTSTTTTPRCWPILDEGRIGETYLIGADGERNNLEVVAADPAS